MITRGSPALGFGTGSLEEQDEKELVKNDGFYPDIDLLALIQEAQVVPGVTNSKLVKSVVAAVMDINNQLRAWKAQQIVTGHDLLKDVPAKEVDETSVLVQSYLRAIYETVDADLTEKNPNYDTTAAGDRQAGALQDRIGTARRNAFWAVQFILGYDEKENEPTSKIEVYVI